MIFIAGISPKTKVLDQNPRRCPQCGLHQAYNKRIDHYFSLFFIPLFRVKKGAPFIICNRCERTMTEFGQNFGPYPDETRLLCKNCGNPTNRGFKYCPNCGKEI